MPFYERLPALPENSKFAFNLIFFIIVFSTARSQNMKKYDVDGFIAVRYDYGFLPFTFDNKVKNNNVVFKSNINATIANIPFGIIFYHSLVKPIGGEMNQLSFQFDPIRFKRTLLEKQTNKLTEVENKLDSLYNAKSDLQTKIYKYNYKLDSINALNKEISDNDLLLSYDTLKITNSDQLVSDSLSFNNPVYDSNNSFDVQKYEQNRQRFIEIERNLSALKQNLDHVDSSIKEYESTKTNIKKLYTSDTFQADDKLITNKQKFLNGLSKFELGVTSPSYSEFVLNTAIKGINIQGEYNSICYALTNGSVVDYYYLNTRNSNFGRDIAKDFENLFSFSTSAKGSKISSCQLGYQLNDKTRFAVNFLSGKRRFGFVSSDGNSDNAINYSKNLVAEFQTSYTPIKNFKIDFSIAQSSLANQYSNSSALTEQPELFNSKKSGALSIRINTQILAKYELSVSSKYTQPFFKSFGLIGLRNDLLSSRTKISRNFGKLNFGAHYRYDVDNLSGLNTFQNYSKSGGLQASLKLTKAFAIKSSFSPILIKTVNDETNEIREFKNYNTFFSLSHKLKLKSKAVVLTDLSFNQNYSIDYSEFLAVKSFVLSQSIDYKKNLFNFSAYYISSNSEILKINTRGTEILYGTRALNDKMEITASFKTEINHHTFSPGYKVECGYFFSKNIFIKAGLERFIAQPMIISEAYAAADNGNFYSFELRYLLK